MAEHDPIRSSIISSLFSPHSKGSAGQTGQTYIAHCKTWEEASTIGERKPRYILLAVGTTARVFLHKSKRNTNGSFSIGKTWDIIELRTVELIDESAFSLTIGQRSYTWLAENSQERDRFVNVLVRSFRQYSKGELPDLIGLPNDDHASPAYSIPIPGSPVTSVHSSNSTGVRTRPVNPLTSPNSLKSSTNLRPSPVPPTSFRSPSPSTPRSAHGGTSFATPAPSIATNFTNSSSPAPIFNDESTRRPPHTPQLSIGIEPPITSPQPSLSHSRASVEDETHLATSPSSPRKTSRLKVSIAGLLLNHRSNSRNTPTAPNSPASNRVISSPLKVTHDRYPAIEPRLITSETHEPVGQSLSEEDRGLPSSAAVSKLAQPPSSKSTSRPRNSFMLKQTAPPAVTSEKVKISKQSGETDIDIPDVLSNVEEILEGFQWRPISSDGATESVNQIEEQLMTELKALELAEIHAIIENDNRVGTIVTHLDESLAELDKMEVLLSIYRTQLNMVDEDVIHIESQNRGLQVQMSNQRALLEEIEGLR
ncbi:uncharacterized protein VP01_1811g3 [Puccinia sorghi]|uniref:Exocyst complex component Sec3 PIP2-binding N-terminal domain-containing protein n=1 Tax=Puccinia sorghi TaxID=27349 RepID=A0A0L6VE83_9BASI|nr:uncharacterized protein VP01_1811g3 [Puccinia sorghi]